MTPSTTSPRSPGPSSSPPTNGTLTAADVEGTLDLVSGEFGARSSTVTGTDDYADVTGKLRVWGTQDLTDGTFSEHLLAKLCVPKKKQH